MDTPDFISAFTDFLDQYKNSILIYQQPNRWPSRNYFDRILADQAECWYSTDLTSLNR